MRGASARGVRRLASAAAPALVVWGATASAAEANGRCDPADVAGYERDANAALRETTAFIAAIAPNPQATAADVLANQLGRVTDALVASICLGAVGDKGQAAEGAAAYVTASKQRAYLLPLLAHARARDAALAAKKAADDAAAAKNAEDARAAAKAADRAVADARAQRDFMNDAYTAAALDAAIVSANAAQSEADLRAVAPDTMCGADDKGRPKKICGTFGIFAAALSYVWVWTDATNITSRPHLASVGVPSVALRYVPWTTGWVSLEWGGYSAFLTKSLTASSPAGTKSACVRSPSDYENRLPCEANPDAYPYLGTYVGATVGRSGVGFLTIAPTLGVAQLGSASALRPYFGLTIGILNINGKF